MTELEAKRWMEALAGSGSRAPLPDFDGLWSRSRLEQEFERRRRLTAPLVWIDATLQCATGLVVAVLLVWLGGV